MAQDGVMPARRETPFERNEFGHVILAFTSLGLTGRQEVERRKGYKLGIYAEHCLIDSADDESYDKKHLLVTGEEYEIALVPARSIPVDAYRSSKKLRELGLSYGYGEPLAGHIPPISEIVSDEQMKEMDITYIASLHSPIKDREGHPVVLATNCSLIHDWVRVYWNTSSYAQWPDLGAFAFPVIKK